MKTILNLGALFTIALLVFSFGCASAQSMRPETNWLEAWKKFAGSQYAATWLQAEVANGASLLSDPATGMLIVKVPADWNSMNDLMTVLEEGIQSSNGDRMLPGGTATDLGRDMAMNSWQGQLGGKQLYAMVIGQLGEGGNSHLVIRLAATPLPDAADMNPELALALLGQVGVATTEFLTAAETH